MFSPHHKVYTWIRVKFRVFDRKRKCHFMMGCTALFKSSNGSVTYSEILYENRHCCKDMLQYYMIYFKFSYFSIFKHLTLNALQSIQSKIQVFKIYAPLRSVFRESLCIYNIYFVFLSGRRIPPLLLLMRFLPFLSFSLPNSRNKFLILSNLQ